MLNLNAITTRLFTSIKPETITLGPDSLVTVQTMIYGQQTGVIEKIALSPFCGEENIYRARVVNLPGAPFFIDYILVDDLIAAEPDFTVQAQPSPADDLCDCTDCDGRFEESMMCGECGLCLPNCCSCPKHWIDDDEAEEYQHPRFMYLGKAFPASID